jgi:rod shape-determining protein MreD
LRRNVLWVVIVIAAALIQTTWLEALAIRNVQPDLTLLLVVYFALRHGEERAMFTGVLGGLFQDVAANAVLCHHVLGHVIVGFAVGRIGARLVTEHPVVKTGLVFMASLMEGIIYTTVLLIQQPGMFGVGLIVERVVPGAFYTALVTPIVFGALDMIFARKERYSAEEV